MAGDIGKFYFAEVCDTYPVTMKATKHGQEASRRQMNCTHSYDTSINRSEYTCGDFCSLLLDFEYLGREWKRQNGLIGVRGFRQIGLKEDWGREALGAGNCMIAHIARPWRIYFRQRKCGSPMVIYMLNSRSCHKWFANPSLCLEMVLNIEMGGPPLILTIWKWEITCHAVLTSYLKSNQVLGF